MRFGYTILYVDDVVDTLDFYQRAFGFRQKFLHPAGDYGELDTGDTVLAFSSLELMTSLGKSARRAGLAGATFEIAFIADDVAAALAQALAAGAQLVQDVEQKPWGQTTAYVADSNGFLIEICSPLDR